MVFHLFWVANRGDSFVLSIDRFLSACVETTWEDVAVTNMVGACLMWIGKVCSIILHYVYMNCITSTVLPLIVIFLLSYLVATCFVTVL